jgi:hypothetical protein
MDLQFRAEQADLDRQTQLTVAEIRSAGLGAGVDINQNQMSDYQDAMVNIQKQDNYQDTMNFKREQEINKNATNQQKLNINREELQTRKEIADKQLQIARENKNKYDVAKSSRKKEG